MSEKLKNYEIVNIIECEGLAYTITGYMDSKSIKDPKLAEMWDKANDAINAIEEYLDL